jgi:hypothetical protein
LQVSGCFGAQLPVGQEIFREFLDSDMPIVARPSALKPLPCFQQQSRRVSFGLPDDPKHMHFLHGQVSQLDRTSPLDFEDEPFGFGLRREEPAAPFPNLRQSGGYNDLPTFPGFAPKGLHVGKGIALCCTFSRFFCRFRPFRKTPFSPHSYEISIA